MLECGRPMPRMIQGSTGRARNATALPWPCPSFVSGSAPRNSRSREAASFVSGHETILRHGRSHFLKPRRYPETGA